MGRLFKKFRLEKANERRTEKERPRIGKVQEIKSHVREHKEIDKVFHCLSIPSRRRTAYRKIIGLGDAELERNIFLVLEKALEVVVSFEPVDKLFYSALRRIIHLKNGVSVHNLLMDYFVASTLCGANYRDFGAFLLRHTPQLLAINKDRILPNVSDGELKRKISVLRTEEKYSVIKYQQKVMILKDRILIYGGQTN